MAKCESCGENEGTLDLYHDKPGMSVMVCPGCYEDLARDNATLTPLLVHPDYDGEW